MDLSYSLESFIFKLSCDKVRCRDFVTIDEISFESLMEYVRSQFPVIISVTHKLSMTNIHLAQKGVETEQGVKFEKVVFLQGSFGHLSGIQTFKCIKVTTIDIDKDEDKDKARIEHAEGKNFFKKNSSWGMKRVPATVFDADVPN